MVMTQRSGPHSGGADQAIRGLLGIDGVAPDLGDLRIAIHVSSTSPADRIEAMLGAWRERCPIFLALRNANQVDVTTAVGAAAA